jgi:spermidine/putrescine transport system permease protein
MRPSRVPLVVSLLMAVFLYIPIVMLVVQSFNAARFGGQWEGFSFIWYERLLDNRPVWLATRQSLIVAVTSTLFSTVLGTIAAWALHRYRSRLQDAHYLLVYSPLVVPDILMGMSLLLLFVNLGVQLGVGTVMVAHITFCTSYVAFVLLGRLQDFDFSLIDAARDLGAREATIFLKIILPLLGPGILAGALLAFTLSIDDFVITFFVSGPGSSTLPVHVYSMMKHGTPSLINALSVILMTVTFSLVLISQPLLKKHTQ